MRRPRLVLLVLVAALLGLSGCAGIGGTSPVQPGLEVGGADAPRVRVFFPGPVNGATPESIIRGFLRSGAASDGDYDTARSFLTPDAAKSWVPDGEILVFSTEADVAIHTVDDATTTVTVPALARISADGRYAAAAPGDTVQATFRFARIEGEWRIAQLPDGFARWLAGADVGRLVQPYAVNYVAVDRRALIQDLRWFPLDHLTSRLARAQLAPVPDALAGVATTAVPAGTRLAAESVSVVDGVATVDLSVRPPADQAPRQNLWAQFVATLTQDPSVVSVTLQVDGSAIEPPGASVPVSDPSQVGFAPIPLTTAAPLVRRGDRLWPLDTEAPISGQDPKSAAPARDDLPAIGAAWTSVAVSADVRDVAALTRDGNNLARWRGRDRYDVAPFGSSLAPPTFDSRGYLWTAIGGRSDGNPVRVISLAEAPATAAPREVSADWLAGEAVQAVKVSPDGERVALLVGTEGGASRLLVAGVVRGAGAAPTSLAEPVELGAQVGRKQAVVWLSSTSVATLATAEGGVTRPVVLSLDGTSLSLPDTPAALSLTSADNERGLVVLDSSGHVLVRAGQLWLSAGEGAEVLVPGR